MTSKVDALEDIGVIQVKAAGDVSAEELWGQIKDVVRVGQETGLRRVFVDTEQEQSAPPTFDIFEFMSQLPTEYVYAMYVSQAQTTAPDINFAANVGSNRGIRVRHFTDRQEALSWLLEQPVDEPSL